MGLEVSIKKKTGDFTLDVSFNCEDQVTSLLGASGSGKSMTLKCIAGIETPDEGRIVLNGRELFDSGKKINLIPQERKVGYMFQDYALFPNMTVRQNIEIACESKSESISYIDRFQLSDIADLYPSQLSGGQKQRTAMARMLAAKPDMLMLDEPFAALDSHLKWQIENEVKKILREEKKPALFVSHDRDEVYRLSEHAGIIVNGKMKGVSDTRELFRNPRTRSAAAVTGCKNVTRAVKTDEFKVSAPDWGMEFELASPVPFTEGYIGIRAHSFEMVDSGYGDRNCLNIKFSEISEEPFEWNVSFKTDESAEWIQWKISKDMFRQCEEIIPEKLWVKPENIMLLQDD